MNRRGDSEEALRVRLQNSEKEIRECLDFKDVIRIRIVNDNLDIATEKFLGVVEALYATELGLDEKM